VTTEEKGKNATVNRYSVILLGCRRFIRAFRMSSRLFPCFELDSFCLLSIVGTRPNTPNAIPRENERSPVACGGIRSFSRTHITKFRNGLEQVFVLAYFINGSRQAVGPVEFVVGSRHVDSLGRRVFRIPFV